VKKKKQQVIALGKLGWPLRRIEQATGVRRETAGAYLKTAGIGVRPPGAWGRRAPAKPANEVTPDPGPSKPANEVTPDFIAPFSAKQGAPSDPFPPSATVCEAYRDGKVESGIGHTQKTPLKGMRFESLEEAQLYLDRWEQRWANTRIHRYYQYGERVVHLDGCVEVEAAYYSLPPGWIGRPVKVQWDELHVRILHPNTNQLLREHLHQKRGGYRIQEEDHPKKMPLSTAQLLRRAEHAGTGIGKLCQLIYQQQGEQGIRRILGML
jgi:hypothetical protein